MMLSALTAGAVGVGGVAATLPIENDGGAVAVAGAIVGEGLGAIVGVKVTGTGKGVADALGIGVGKTTDCVG